MSLDSNIVFCIPSGSTVPSGWTRDTRFDDGVYLKFAESGSDPTTGGSANHTHPNANHTHSVSLGATGSQSTNPGMVGAAANHTHGSSASANAAVTPGSASNDLYYFEMIFIKPSTGSGCPNGACAWWDDSALPTDWSEHGGSKGYYLRGAASGGAAGSTGGGVTHNHDLSHSHGSAVSAKDTTKRGTAAGGGNVAAIGHTHNVSLNSQTVTSGNGSSEPPYHKLRVVQNGTGGEDLPDQIFALFLGNDADVPANWARYTAVDGAFLKCANNAGEVGDTGGADTHTHTDLSGHSHSATVGGPNTQSSADTFGVASTSSRTHTHPATVGNASLNLSANTSKSHYPTFQEAILVRYTEPAGAAPSLALTGVGL